MRPNTLAQLVEMPDVSYVGRIAGRRDDNRATPLTLLTAGAILTAALAIATEGILALVQRKVTPKGLRDRDLALEAAQ